MNKTAERALLARPLALCLGAWAVVWLNPNLRQDTMFFWIAVIFGGPNILIWVARDRRPIGRVAAIASPAINLLGWGTLATFSLGLKSPILAAFFFEVALAAVSAGPLGVAAVTAAAIAVLGLVQTLFGLSAGWQLLLLESSFLMVMGGLGIAIAQRRVAGEAALRIQGDELGQRLDALQRQLEDERVVSRVGENVARLAHGLKNAVHSLRGFVSLIEPEVERGGASREALAGLRAAIDDLERLARLTLAEPPTGLLNEVTAARAGHDAVESMAVQAVRRGVEPVFVAGAIEAAARGLGSASPEMTFDLRLTQEARSLAVELDETPLQELLTILLRNAVEAMRGVGCCTVELTRRGERCQISIADEGEGLRHETEDRLFTPGFTTKVGGSGFGLFLARRIVEDHGGSLELVAGPEKGAIARLELPLSRVGLDVGTEDGGGRSERTARLGGAGA